MITLLCSILHQIHQEVLIFYKGNEKSKLLDGLSVNDEVKVLNTSKDFLQKKWSISSH